MEPHAIGFKRIKRQTIKKQSSLSVCRTRYNINEAFLGGLISVFAIFPSRRVIKFQSSDEDIQAIASDWREVGGLIRYSMMNFKSIDR